ncbi:hypothetical protein L7F22_018181 [Adiantum nelumboides]|nr:hypothetical protein [Adiantum nelumboides]
MSRSDVQGLEQVFVAMLIGGALHEVMQLTKWGGKRRPVCRQGMGKLPLMARNRQQETKGLAVGGKGGVGMHRWVFLCRFWCCFGPDDYRGQVPKPHAKRRATKGKHFVGCQCHFVVSQLYLFPDVAKINYIQYEHIDGSGNICHGDLYDGPMNKLKFPPRLSSQMRDWFYLYTILVFDAFRNGVPIAWTITSSACRSNITTWLAALRNRVLNLNKGWEPNAFMVDDAEADIQALREVFGIGIPVLLCIWHVRRAWLKNLVKKVADATLRADMFRQLGMIMNMRGSPCRSSHDKESEAHKLVVDFMVKYESEVLFIDYFKREWLPRIGMWIRSSRMMRIANQDTNGSIEAYHGILKSKFLGGRRSIHGRRVDWLIKMLVSSCHSYQVKVMMMIGIDVNTIVNTGVNMYNKEVQEGAKSMQSIIEPFDSLDHFSPIAHVDSPPNKSSSCKENDGKDYVSLIQNNILQSLQIAGNESSLLEHIHRLSVQILAST